MSLQAFKSTLNNKNVIAVSDFNSIKGGLRYETANFSQYAQKLSGLYAQGKQCCVGFHNGKYCIEW